MQLFSKQIVHSVMKWLGGILVIWIVISSERAQGKKISHSTNNQPHSPMQSHMITCLCIVIVHITGKVILVEWIESTMHTNISTSIHLIHPYHICIII